MEARTLGTGHRSISKTATHELAMVVDPAAVTLWGGNSSASSASGLSAGSRPPRSQWPMSPNAGRNLAAAIARIRGEDPA
jgi:hypothetical protein